MKKNENKIQKEELIFMQEEANFKDAENNKQLAGGKNMNNLANRHQQTEQKHEQLQYNYIELKEKRRDLQLKGIKKSSDLNDKIRSINGNVGMIKLSSSIAIDEFPQFESLDFDKKFNNTK